jgi:hypothetical protein
MTLPEQRVPNQKLRTTTVETTTTGPNDGDYSRRTEVATATGENDGNYARPLAAEAADIGSGNSAGLASVPATEPNTGQYPPRPIMAQIVEPRPEYASPVRVKSPGPSHGEYARRITVFVAGIVQSLIILRIVLMLFDARATNGLVAVILDVSSVFVAPFQGILHVATLAKSGSVLDVTAIIALIGWTLAEGLVIAGIAIFRREPALA